MRKIEVALLVAKYIQIYELENILKKCTIVIEGQRKSKSEVFDKNILEVFNMFGLTPYNKWRKGVENKRDAWGPDRMFDAMFDEFFDMSPSANFMDMMEGQVKVDIKENDDEYVLVADLPGVEKDDIVLELKDDVLTINVERKEECNEERENYIRKERKYGSMSRSFYVDDVDQDNIGAEFKNGVLKIVLPKVESKGRGANRIEIK